MSRHAPVDGAGTSARELVDDGSGLAGSERIDAVQIDAVQTVPVQIEDVRLDDVQLEDAPETILPSLEVALATVGSFLLIYLLGRFLLVPSITRVFSRRNQRNPTVVEAVERFSTLVVVIVAGAVATAVAGFGHVLSGSAMVIAAGTLALGVAGQAVIGNVVSGLFLVADPEFNVDDWIAWEGGEGVVESIRFRVTRVRTANDEVITVPNTTLATTEISRPYSRERHRIVVRVGIAHDEDASEAVDAVRDAIDAVEGVLAEPAPTVVVDELGDDALWLRSMFWVGDPTRGDVRDARSTYIRTLQERLKERGIAFSPPSDHELSGAIEVTDADARP